MRMSDLFEGRSASKEMKLIQLKSDLKYIKASASSQEQADAVDDLTHTIAKLEKEIQTEKGMK